MSLDAHYSPGHQVNYRHVYHAGSFADVFKHVVLVALVRHLRRKDKPFACIDTHAGPGRYDLDGEAARRTGEADGGIEQLLAAPGPHPEAVSDYLAQVRAARGEAAARIYPGSPDLVRGLLRPGDRAVLCELHEEDGAALAHRYRGDEQVAVHRRDGYEALKALLPPVERRGLVLVDPPFEVRDEFRRLAAGLVAAQQRWPTGIYALWYPVVYREDAAAFHAALAGSGVPRILVCELHPWPDDLPGRFSGAGLALVNPPWRLEEMLAEALPALLRGIGAASGRWRVDWLAGE